MKQCFQRRIKALNILGYYLDLERDTYKLCINTAIVDDMIDNLFFGNAKLDENNNEGGCDSADEAR